MPGYLFFLIIRYFCMADTACHLLYSMGVAYLLQDAGLVQRRSGAFFQVITEVVEQGFLACGFELISR